jgi:hypothetical protein
MNQEPETTELLPLNAIRIETVLSRFPVHRLAKRGSISIDINEKTDAGEIKTKWEVSYNTKYGQPGPLAYKVDSLIINRRIEEAPRPLPKIIKLGSLRDLCRELDLNEGQATRNIKKALLQNASAFITSKRAYKGNDGTERTAEISDTRYGVIFTGEKFPDGGRADAVYLLLHDAYREVLNSSPTRPLDYDYLKELSPGAQRLYELLSYQIFAALRNERPRAKMLYSYYCTRAPQTRYLDYDHVKKQMYKLHAPHKKSGYITAIEFRETTDVVGQPDWEMFYTPGRRAKAEFRESMRKPRQQVERRSARPELPPAPIVEAKPVGDDPLIEQLRKLGVTETKARELVKTRRAATEEQIAAFPYRELGQGTKNVAGWLIAAIENNYELPEAYVEAKAKAQEVKRGQEKRQAVETCQLCDEQGRRFIKSERYPSGAIKPCSHDPEIEARYPSM